MRKPLRLVVAVLGLLLVHATAAPAAITGVTLDPPFPSSHELVHLTVTGQGPLCALPLEATVTDPADFLSSGRILLRLVACPVTPPPPDVPFADTVIVGPLREGSYTVETEDQLFTAQLTVRDFHPLPINSLFLANRRFEASVAWRTATAAGVGQPEALTNNSGYFWFFDPSSAELVVKVIDGTAVNGHFWVFLGGLSDVDYTVTITDRYTQKERTYTNPRGTLVSEADTKAF